MPSLWERIDKHTWRLQVAGGWLVWSNYINDVASPVFVSDPGNTWTIGELND